MINILEVLLFSFLAVVTGLGLTFLGYSAFRILLPFIGFFAGFWLGMDVVSNFAANFPIMGFSLGLILGLIFGLVLAALSYFVYSVGIMVVGLSLGYAIGAGIMLAIGFDYGIMTLIVGILTSALFGYLFWKGEMPKIYIMAITAFAGASAIIAGILVLFGQIPPSQLGLAVIDSYIKQSWFFIIVWFVIGVFGFSFQYQITKVAESMIPATYSFDSTTKEYAQKSKKNKS